MIETLQGNGYEISVVVGDQPLNPECDNVDVVVKFPGGKHYAAVFTTLSSIRERLESFKETGECASGLYFWTSDLIIVERLTVDVVAATVQALIENDEFEMAFSDPSFDISPIPD